MKATGYYATLYVAKEQKKKKKMDNEHPLLPQETTDEESKNILIKQDPSALKDKSFSIIYTTDVRSSSINVELEKYIQMREELAKYKGMIEGVKKESENIKKTLQAVPTSPTSVQVDITNTNDIKISSNIELAYQHLQSDRMQESHSPEEIETFRQQLDELKKIVEGDKKKAEKWKTAGNIVKWLAEQTIDVAKIFGPILLKDLLGIGD